MILEVFFLPNINTMNAYDPYLINYGNIFDIL